MRHVEVELPQDLIDKMESLPKAGRGVQAYEFTPEQDAALLKYWPIKRHRDVAKALDISEATAIRRYRQLTETE